ncbi:MAG: translation initiation factor [Oligosphaeraceae bacterium]
MKRKKKESAQAPAASTLNEQNWNNPFLDLKLDLPEPPKPPPPPPPSPEELRVSALSPEDQALLKAFGGDAALDLNPQAATPKKRRKLTFQLRRKGRGGKTVTCVQGLQELELPEQMELCSRVKEALGIGAHFVEGVLELQGDQIQRASQWFGKEGFLCP